MARPVKFDADTARLASLLKRDGFSNMIIARDCGISRRTLQGWLARGRAGAPPSADFAREFDRAAETGRKRLWLIRFQRDMIRSRRSWRRFKAARELWWLERLGPERFWRRRLRWLAERGHAAAYERTLAQVHALGFCTHPAL
jgi:hypothetical protein